MASVHDVIRQYRPELELEDAVPADEVVSFVAEKSEVEADSVRSVLEAMPELLEEFLLQGRPVTLSGVGQVKPTIDLDGTIRLGVDTEEALQGTLSEPDAYRGGVNRRENIGASLERLAQMWNSSHPDDPVQDVHAYALAGE